MAPTELEQSPIREADVGRWMKMGISFLGVMLLVGTALWSGAIWVGSVNNKLDQLQTGASDQKHQIEILNEKLDRIFEREGGIVPQKGKPVSRLERQTMTVEALPQDASNPDLRR